MPETINAFGQPIGPALPGWSPPPLPPATPMEGRYCRLEPLNAERHADALYAAYRLDPDGRNWTYLPYGPFPSADTYRDWVRACEQIADPLLFSIIPKSDGLPAGVAGYLRIAPQAGSIEVGHLHFSERLKHSPSATEAMYLMMERAFALGYRRYEWKCDALNAPSRAAAQRLGLSYEGIFRQATVYKGRSRDTAWYAAIDSEWPALRQAFATWLAPENFDERGQQRQRLSELTQPILKARG